MLKASLIGIGAGGNKAAIQTILDGNIPKEKTTLLNTTLKDIPEEYHDIAVNFASYTDMHGGCGKERSLSRSTMRGAIQNDAIDLDAYVDDDDDMVIIYATTEGGTGSGAASFISKYYDTQLNIPVVLFAFTGFEDDARSKQNTVQFFTELVDEEGKVPYSVHAISNKKFKCTNRIAAENAANKQASGAVRQLLGLDLIDCEQNIDNTDLLKVSTTLGYNMVAFTKIEDRIKNTDQFNDILIDMIDNCPVLNPPINNRMPRMALILNLNERSQEYADATAQEVRKRLGDVYELFIQRQWNGKDEFIAVICAGMNMPMDEINSIHQRYLAEKAELEKNKDEFGKKITELEVEDDSEFNVRQRRRKKASTADKRAFLKSVDDVEDIPVKSKAKEFVKEEQDAVPTNRQVLFEPDVSDIPEVKESNDNWNGNLSTADTHDAVHDEDVEKTNEFVNTRIIRINPNNSED